jgi:colanic acid biosynthesis glycosyl transferase WcaI
MLLVALRWRPEVVLVVEPPLACAPAALLAARLSGAAAWLHVQDLEVDAAFDLGVLRAPLARRVLLAMERWLLAHFDRVSSLSAQMLERLQAKGVPVDRLQLFPNWTELAQIPELQAPSRLRQEWGVAAGQLVLLYSGSLGAKQGLELLILVARRLPKSTLALFVICGEGPAKASLQDLAGNSSRFRFLPLQPLERLNALLQAADIHLLPQRGGAEGLVMPSKLAGMMASGRPVIACASPGSDVATVVAGCGEVVAPGDVTGFAAAVEKLAAAPALRQEYGDRGRERAAAMWDRDRILTEVFETIPLASRRTPSPGAAGAVPVVRGADVP